MNQDPGDKGGGEIKWVIGTPEEEQSRVAEHVEMIREMLAEKPEDLDLNGANKVVVTEVYFDLFLRDGDKVTLGPYNYTGILAGLEFDTGEPVLVVENLRTELLGDMPDDGWEFEYEIVVSTEELARIPLRDINAIGGSATTPDGWEALSRRRTDETES